MKKSEEDNSRKALVVTTVASTIDQFCMNDINILQESYKVFVAANFDIGNNTSKDRVKEFKSELHRMNIGVNEVEFSRNPFSRNNLNAYRKIHKLIESSSFDIIHCHTPVAAMLVRLAARNARKKGTRVIYTAHGFHFYRGAPKRNWLLYYPIERWLARTTDELITINKEDYDRARKSFRAKKIRYIPGIGIDLETFKQADVSKMEKLKEIGIPEDGFVLLSVGELNKNKNHEIVIKALSKINNPNFYYVICGQGELEDYLKRTIKELGLERQVKLLGFRKDIAELCKVINVYIFPSHREGLSVALMEAMAMSLPVVCSKIRGNVDLIEDGKGGYLINPSDIDGFADAVTNLYNNPRLRSDFGFYNSGRITKYSIENVKREMKKIYSGGTLNDH